VLLQLDVEMSFVIQDDIKSLIEQLLKHCWPPHLEPLSLPLPRLSYVDAIQRYGSDKPDTRYDSLVIYIVILITLWVVTWVLASDSSVRSVRSQLVYEEKIMSTS